MDIFPIQYSYIIIVYIYKHLIGVHIIEMFLDIDYKLLLIFDKYL